MVVSQERRMGRMEKNGESILVEKGKESQVYSVGQRDAFFACNCQDLCFVEAFGREPLPDYHG